MKSLAELASVVPDAQVIGTAEISDVCCDSRKVKPGDLFVCVCGYSSDGHRYAAEAVTKGAVALVVEHPVDGLEVPYIQVPDSRRALALIAAAFFDYPASKLTTIGITGTNGKTTTAFFIEAVLEELGRNPGLLGTIEAHVAGEVRQLSNTTPESLDLQRYFAQMRDSGQSSVVMEVSSHALAQGRTLGIPYDVAVFTNLTQDHLDFHGDMESYFKAKCKLFTDLGTHKGRSVGPYAVINIDDPYGRRLYELVRNRVPVITYGVDAKADVRGFNVDATPEGLTFLVESRLEVRQVHLQMSGLFNLHNCLAALAVGVALRGGLARAVKAVESVSSVPGRFQLVRAGQNFTVIVDYAHTPDGLQHLLDSARAITTRELAVVFGCGGDRDKGKRPIMGEIAARTADRVFVTSDNPRSEDIEAIIADIMVGIERCQSQAKVEVISDRAKAIAKAIATAQEGDTVVIAGKGHETYQKFRDRTVHFDDVEVARENLAHCSGSELMGRVQTSVHMSISWDRSRWRTWEEIGRHLDGTYDKPY